MPKCKFEDFTPAFDDLSFIITTAHLGEIFKLFCFAVFLIRLTIVCVL